MELLEILQSKTIIDPNTNCWLWRGGLNKAGYGGVTYKFRTFHVHRLSAYLHLGLNLSNKQEQALHKLECKNKNCWNPEHLYVGTNSDNVKDALINGASQYQRGSRGLTHCKYGHEYNSENTSFNPNGTKRCKTCMRESAKQRYISVK